MTGDEQFPEPGPVAEYRDPELVRRFEREPVPQHGAGFWAELESRLGLPGADADADTDTEPSDGTDTGEGVEEIESLTTPIELLPAQAGGGRWGTGRWLAAAAAVLAVLGLGGAALVSQGRSSSPVSSAAPALDQSDDGAEIDAEEPNPSSTSSTAVSTTTTTEPVTTTSTTSAVADPVVDYFEDDVKVDSIGRGLVKAFSPDGSAVLILDDAPGVAAGCEGAELLALYTQSLATGQRQPTMGQGASIETGGLDLIVDPFGATPDEVGTRPVYGRESCDGEPSLLWRGMLSGAGQIANLEPVSIGAADDPFAGSGSAGGSAGGSGGGADGSSIVAPDGRHVLVAEGSSAEVREVDTDGDGVADSAVASLPDGIEVASVLAAAWTPDGQAVALSTDGALLLWNPWTGASQSLPGGGARTLLFDGTGGRLAVGDGTTITILTFGDRTEPVAAPPRCSGRIDLDPLIASKLSDQGLPTEVVETVLAIDDAASTCNWTALDRLTDEDFVSSLGGDDPVAFWRSEEAAGSSPMWYLRALFRQANAIEAADGGGAHIWPAINQDDDCQLDEAERASAVALGLDPVATEEACLVTGGYSGFRTSIGPDGRWRSFHLAG